MIQQNVPPPVQSPAYRIAQPANRIAQPAYRIAQPAYRIAQPANRIAQPANRIAQPAYRIPQPAYRIPQPANRIAQPAPRPPARRINAPGGRAAAAHPVCAGGVPADEPSRARAGRAFNRRGAHSSRRSGWAGAGRTARSCVRGGLGSAAGRDRAAVTVTAPGDSDAGWRACWRARRRWREWRHAPAVGARDARGPVPAQGATAGARPHPGSAGRRGARCGRGADGVGAPPAPRGRTRGHGQHRRRSTASHGPARPGRSFRGPTDATIRVRYPGFKLFRARDPGLSRLGDSSDSEFASLPGPENVPE
jgi:hypothetical protein